MYSIKSWSCSEQYTWKFEGHLVIFVRVRKSDASSYLLAFPCQRVSQWHVAHLLRLSSYDLSARGGETFSIQLNTYFIRYGGDDTQQGVPHWGGQTAVVLNAGKLLIKCIPPIEVVWHHLWFTCNKKVKISSPWINGLTHLLILLQDAQQKQVSNEFNMMVWNVHECSMPAAIVDMFIIMA